ncbi:MAG: phage holin family protein, partial [Chloroflexi bacterium]|nr:phage holin family protein [Chloroflexota bacterium]
MRRFLFEALVDTLILIGLAFLLSLIHIPQPFPFGSGRAPIMAGIGAGFIAFFVFAVILGVVNRGVRPVIVAFSGRLVLATAGSFMVVITWLVFWVTAIFAPDLVVVADPTILWTLILAALYGLVSI